MESDWPWRRLSVESVSSGVWTNAVWNLQRGIVELRTAGGFEGLAAVRGGLPPAVPNTNGRRENPAQGSGRRDSLLEARLPWLSLVAYATSPSPRCTGPEAFGVRCFARRLLGELGELARLHLRLGWGLLSPLPLPRSRAGANDQIQAVLVYYSSKYLFCWF